MLLKLAGVTMTNRPILLNLSSVALKELLTAWGEPAYRAGQIETWLYQQHVDDVSQMSSLPKSLRQRLAERQIEIELTDAAKMHLVREGYDPNYGARPLKRAIQREIETPLGRRILKGEVRDGQKVVVDFDRASGGLIFTTEAVVSKERVASRGD